MKIFATFLFLTLLLTTSSCISYRNNLLPEVKKETQQSSSVKKTKIFGQWTSSSSKSLSKSRQFQENELLKKRFKDASLKLSGCCIFVDDKSKADVVIEVTSVNENNNNNIIFPIITGLTLYVIPSWIEAKEHIVANVKAGNKTNSYDLQDSVTLVQWLPLVFAMPFRDNIFKPAEDMFDNLLLTLLSRMQNDGIIKKN